MNSSSLKNVDKKGLEQLETPFVLCENAIIVRMSPTAVRVFCICFHFCNGVLEIMIGANFNTIIEYYSNFVSCTSSILQSNVEKQT